MRVNSSWHGKHHFVYFEDTEILKSKSVCSFMACSNIWENCATGGSGEAISLPVFLLLSLLICSISASFSPFPSPSPPFPSSFLPFPPCFPFPSYFPSPFLLPFPLPFPHLLPLPSPSYSLPPFLLSPPLPQSVPRAPIRHLRRLSDGCLGVTLRCPIRSLTWHHTCGVPRVPGLEEGMKVP